LPIRAHFAYHCVIGSGSTGRAFSVQVDLPSWKAEHPQTMLATECPGVCICSRQIVLLFMSRDEQRIREQAPATRNVPVRWFRVQIDLAAVCEKLSREDQRPYCEDDVRKWLTDAGFVVAPEDFWIVREPDLGHLTPDEVTSIDEITLPPTRQPPGS